VSTPARYCVQCDAPWTGEFCLGCGCKHFACTPRAVWQALAEENIALVPFMLRRFHLPLRVYRKIGGYQELFSAGQMRLVLAAQKFRPELGTTFSTFACRAIINILTYTVGRFYQAKREDMLWELSIDRRSDTTNQKSMTPADLIKDRVNPWIKKNELLDKIYHEYRRLDFREIYLLDEIYKRGRTLEDLAEELEISKERVRQIEERALYKIRRVLNPSHPDQAKYKSKRENYRVWARDNARRLRREKKAAERLAAKDVEGKHDKTEGNALASA
jgi:RNA polymerase sigma factor (sigma-70 family)